MAAKTKDQLFDEIIRKANSGENYESDLRELDKILCQEYWDDDVKEIDKIEIKRIFQEEQGNFDAIENFGNDAPIIVYDLLNNDPSLLEIDLAEIDDDFTSIDFNPNYYIPAYLYDETYINWWL